MGGQEAMPSKRKVTSAGVIALVLGIALALAERVLLISDDRDMPPLAAFLAILLNAVFVALLWEILSSWWRGRPYRRPLAFLGGYMACLLGGYVARRGLVTLQPTFWRGELPLAMVVTPLLISLAVGLWRRVRVLRT